MCRSALFLFFFLAWKTWKRPKRDINTHTHTHTQDIISHPVMDESSMNANTVHIDANAEADARFCLGLERASRMEGLIK